MKTKYQFINIHMFERKALESYLHEMALQGWCIDKLRFCYLRFRKSEPCDRYYHVGFDNDTGIFMQVYDEGKDSNYTAFMESFGYKYISSIGIMRLFESETDDTMFSEPEIDERAFRSAVYRVESTKSVYPFIAFLVLFINLTYFSSLWDLASNAYLFSRAVVAIMTFYCFFQMIPYLRYCIHHREQTDVKIFNRMRTLNVIVPTTLLCIILYCLTPQKYYVSFGIVIVLIFTMRGLLYLAQNHTRHKTLWRTIIIVGYIIGYITTIRYTYTLPISSNIDTGKPIFTAKDFDKPIDGVSNIYEKSVLMKHLDYIDDYASYQYYHVEDTVLAGYCRNQILKNYDISGEEPKEQNGVQYYQLSLGNARNYQYMLVKGNDFLIIGDHLEEYLALFQERV